VFVETRRWLRRPTARSNAAVSRPAARLRPSPSPSLAAQASFCRRRPQPGRPPESLWRPPVRAPIATSSAQQPSADQLNRTSSLCTPYHSAQRLPPNECKEPLPTRRHPAPQPPQPGERRRTCRSFPVAAWRLVESGLGSDSRRVDGERWV